MTKIMACAMALLLASLCTAEPIYRSTDKNGNPVYTDHPQPEAKPVELPPTNTTPSITPTPRSTPNTPIFTGYSRAQVVTPSTIPNGLAPVTFGIAIEPQLQPGHRWQLLLDGQTVAEGTGGSATLEQIERGTHQLSVQIIDQSEHTLNSSEPIEVFVFWPSKNR